jgi:hypothetical protein
LERASSSCAARSLFLRGAARGHVAAHAAVAAETPRSSNTGSPLTLM